MSFPIFETRLRDYFPCDMWQDFNDSFYDWGFQQPRMRRQTPKRNGTFLRSTDPWRIRTKRRDPSNFIEDTLERSNKMGDESSYENVCKSTAGALKQRQSQSCKYLTQVNKDLANLENDKNEFVHKGPKAKEAGSANVRSKRWKTIEKTSERVRTSEGECDKKEIPSQTEDSSLTEDLSQTEEPSQTEVPSHTEESNKTTEGNEHLEQYDETNEEAEELSTYSQRDEKGENKKTPDGVDQPAVIESNSYTNELVTEKLATINTELSNARELLDRVSKFKGTKEDKEYLCLQELLLRCILYLDIVNSEGLDEVKIARRSAVKEIQKIISELEAKV